MDFDEARDTFGRPRTGPPSSRPLSRPRAARRRLADLAEQPIVDALGEGLDHTVGALGSWSEAVVARGWFPPDPYRRAAG
jgi:hypothetical protein